MKPTILTFADGYLPGFRYGGPIRTISNIVEQLGGEFDFRIVTTDRDYLSKEPYPGIKADNWNSVGKAQVYYASPGKKSLSRFTRLIRTTPHDVLYLNSFFSPYFTLQPLLARRLGWLEKRPIVLAPRGELARSALRINGWKKNPFLLLARHFRLYEGMIWHASSDHESYDIVCALGIGAFPVVFAAPDLVAPTINGSEPRKRVDPFHPLEIVFLSRIDPMKNLQFLIRVLMRVTSNVRLSIFGPIHNATYWETCKQLISRLPKNVTVSYRGSVSPQNVSTIIQQHDLFILPTQGENFGHVIIEALSAGTPVIISDRTPWKDDGAGGCTVIPLDDEGAYVASIEEIAVATPDKLQEMRTAAKAFAEKFAGDTNAVDKTRAIFRMASQSSSELRPG